MNPDGLQPRRVIGAQTCFLAALTRRRLVDTSRASADLAGINGTWPPPILEATRNDTLVVHVTNALDKPTSLHQHGFYFNGSSYYDGAAGVTQCGIPAGQTFTYRTVRRDLLRELTEPSELGATARRHVLGAFAHVRPIRRRLPHAFDPSCVQGLSLY